MSRSDPPLCFVICPIGPPKSDTRKRSDMLFRYIISPALGTEFSVKRADFDGSSGSIVPAMIRDIADAALIIADLSEKNPNTLYELGVAHTLNKAVIHMIAMGNEPPLDVRDVRLIAYDPFDPTSHDEAIGQLKRFSATARRATGASNPVQDALSTERLIHCIQNYSAASSA